MVAAQEPEVNRDRHDPVGVPKLAKGTAAMEEPASQLKDKTPFSVTEPHVAEASEVVCAWKGRLKHVIFALVHALTSSHLYKSLQQRDTSPCQSKGP